VLIRPGQKDRKDRAPAAATMAGAPDPGDIAARRQSVRDLAASQDAVPELCARLGSEAEPSVREVIFVSLVMLKCGAVVEGLVPYLSSDDASLRNEVVEVLQEMPQEIEPYVDRLLADEDSDVRIFAANVMAVLPHVRVPHWLTTIILTDPHVNVCSAAVDSLAAMGDETAIPALRALPARFPDVSYIAFAVDVAIRNIRGD
jgi:HEAT repeat protein